MRDYLEGEEVNRRVGTVEVKYEYIGQRLKTKWLKEEQVGEGHR